MNIQFYHKRLINSKEYKEFLKEHKKAYLGSALFILDKEKGKDEVNFDFYCEKDKDKVFSFEVSKEIVFRELKNYDVRKPEKIKISENLNLLDFEKIILEEMKKNNMKNPAKKFLFSFQRLKKKDYFLITAFLSNLALVKCHIEIKSKKIVLFEKKSFMDMVKMFKGSGKKKKKKK